MDFRDQSCPCRWLRVVASSTVAGSVLCSSRLATHVVLPDNMIEVLSVFSILHPHVLRGPYGSFGPKNGVLQTSQRADADFFIGPRMAVSR